MNAFAGIRPKGGRNPTPLAFFPAVCSGVICFPVGVQPPQPPANFYPAFIGYMHAFCHYARFPYVAGG